MLTDTTPDSLFWVRVFNMDFLKLEDPFAIWSSPGGGGGGGGTVVYCSLSGKLGHTGIG